MDLIRILIAILLPPLGVFLQVGFGGAFWLNILLADTLQAWFAECWWKAGGWAWPIPLWLHVHDGFGDGRGIALTERC